VVTVSMAVAIPHPRAVAVLDQASEGPCRPWDRDGDGL